MKLQMQQEAFSKAIKQKRIVEMGVDLRDLSKRIGVSPATLSRCENGKTPDLLTYATICSWLGVAMDLFFKGDRVKALGSKQEGKNG